MIVKEVVKITDKGEVQSIEIPLPPHTKRIVGVLIVSNVNATLIPSSALPAVLPPTTALPIQAQNGYFSDTEITQYFTVANGVGYQKWDIIERTRTFVFNGSTLVSDTSTYKNMQTGASITPLVADLRLEENGEYDELFANSYFGVNDNVISYPYGLSMIISTRYRKVILNLEADASTDERDLEKLIRIGNSVDANTGMPVGNGGTITLTRKEFEQSSIVGLQTGKTHILQVQLIN